MTRLFKKRAGYVLLKAGSRKTMPNVAYVVEGHPMMDGQKHKLELCSREEAIVVKENLAGTREAKKLVAGDLTAVAPERHVSAEAPADDGKGQPPGSDATTGQQGGQTGDGPTGTDPGAMHEDLQPDGAGLIPEDALSPQEKGALTKRRNKVAERLEKDHGAKFTALPDVVRAQIVDTQIRKADAAEEAAKAEMAK